MAYRDPEANRRYQEDYNRRRREARALSRVRPKSERYDEIEIDNVWMTHDFSIRLTRRERAEIVRRWERSGRSLRSLEELSGWNVSRDARLLNDEQRPLRPEKRAS